MDFLMNNLVEPVKRIAQLGSTTKQSPAFILVDRIGAQYNCLYWGLRAGCVYVKGRLSTS